MGFDKCILPSVDIMKEHIERNGLHDFIRSYTKYDSIMGESDRMQFLEDKIKEYNENNNN